MILNPIKGESIIHWIPFVRAPNMKNIPSNLSATVWSSINHSLALFLSRGSSCSRWQDFSNFVVLQTYKEGIQTSQQMGH